MYTRMILTAALAVGSAACTPPPSGHKPMKLLQYECTETSDPVDFASEEQREIAREQCNGNPDILLSVQFDNDMQPIGIGGGDSTGLGNPNNKRVTKDRRVCWVAINDSGMVQTSSDYDFAVLFTPDDNPTIDAPHESINIHPNAPSNAPYKYTIWTQPIVDGDARICSFLDPMFVIN
jgi:hypothetical protein